MVKSVKKNYLIKYLGIPCVSGINAENVSLEESSSETELFLIKMLDALDKEGVLQISAALSINATVFRRYLAVTSFNNVFTSATLFCRKSN